MIWFDFHTHQQNVPNSLFNVVLNNNETPPEEGHFCAGLHPWFELNDQYISELKKVLENPRCLAIGETGLDRVRKENFEEQIDYFKHHIDLAKIFNKPIVLHCVKAYQDVLQIMNSTKIDLPIVFHDYNGDTQTTERLLKEENVFFSYGDKLFKDNSKGHQSLKTIPLSRLLIETDDSGKPIEDIGLRLSELVGKEYVEVSAYCLDNAQEILKF